MINVLLAGVGGQGTVLAAKVLAQAAQDKGWQVRTAETIGMAQRGGSVTSHIRMGNNGEEIFSPLLTPGSADLVIAFEPGEAARSLSYLAPDGMLVSATTAIQPVTAALAKDAYTGEAMVDAIRKVLVGEGSVVDSDDMGATDASDGETSNVIAMPSPRFFPVEDSEIIAEIGSRRALNTVLLAYAVATGALPISLDDLKDAIRSCVKPRFVDMNLAAIDAVTSLKE